MAKLDFTRKYIPIRNYVEDDFELDSQKKPNNKLPKDDKKLIYIGIGIVILLFIIIILLLVSRDTSSNSPSTQDTQTDTTTVEEPTQQLSKVFDLTVLGTNINLSDIFQYTDNTYLLSHNEYGQIYNNGVPFLDYSNNPDMTDMTDMSYVIYGKVNDDGSSFQNIKYFSDEDFFYNNDTVTIVTDVGSYNFKIFSFYETLYSDNLFTAQYADKYTYFNHVVGYDKKSLYDTDITLSPLKPMVTLVAIDGLRCYVVHAQLED